MMHTAIQKKGLTAATLIIAVMTALLATAAVSFAESAPELSQDETGETAVSVTVSETSPETSPEPADPGQDETTQAADSQAATQQEEDYSEPEEIWELGKVKLARTSFIYTGKAIKPAVTAKGTDGRTLKAGTDYTLSYKNNVNVGTATVTVAGSSTYWGIKNITFKILPAAPKLTTAKGTKKSLQIKWKASSAQAIGYEILCSTSKSFRKGNKTMRVKSGKTKSKSIKGLKRHKTYYVKIRTYKTVRGKTYYSAWSKVRKARTK